MQFHASDRLELEDTAIGQQRKVQATVANDEGAYVRPVMREPIVQIARARCARERERAELQSAGSGGLPRPAAAVAVDAQRQRAVAGELECVARPIGGAQDSAVAARGNPG